MNSTSSQLSSTEYQRRRMRHLQQIPSTGMMKGLSNQDDYSFQQQYGRVNHSRDSSMDDCTNFCDVKGPMSPTAWMCEVTGKKVSQLCRPFMSGNSNVQIGKEDLSIKRSGRHDNSDTSVSSWRERAAKSFLSAHNSEDDDDNDDTDSFKLKPGASPYSKSINHNDNLKNQIMSPIIRPNDPDSANDEPRIIAPNVDKISPISVVEVRLQSIGECVAILCSVDVLKMRSVFFYEVLNEQEENRIYGGRERIWREPLLIPETSPFEAAAFIESLHEGRLLCKGEWNYCWARLSVSWQVQELVLEYAALIDVHFGKLLNFVQRNNWRTNPNVLVGARVAVFRKGATLMPTVVTGLVVDATSTTGYSKVRVLFDSSENKSNSSYSNPVTTSSTTCNSPVTVMRHSSPGRTKVNTLVSHTSKTNVSHVAANGVTAFGDISEPFWIQLPQAVSTHLSQNQSQIITPICYSPITPRYTNESDATKGLSPTYSVWCDPDEAFLSDVKKHISVTDKIIFWEMAKAIMEMPKLSEQCDPVIRNSKDLASILKRTEFRFLWSPDAPDLLPKDAASELISAAYVGNY